MTALDLPGFAAPVADAQATFRAVLDAAARPGQLRTAGADLTAPAPLDPATAAVLLALVDNETPLWLDPMADAARDWLAFHCGADIVAAPQAATFAVGLSLPDITGFSPGSHEMPESSATLIVQVAKLGAGDRYRLSGPGTRDASALSVSGLPADFTDIWQRNHALYPCGIDIILCAGTTLAVLPRSVSIERG